MWDPPLSLNQTLPHPTQSTPCLFYFCHSTVHILGVCLSNEWIMERNRNLFLVPTFHGQRDALTPTGHLCFSSLVGILKWSHSKSYCFQLAGDHGSRQYRVLTSLWLCASSILYLNKSRRAPFLRQRPNRQRVCEPQTRTVDWKEGGDTPLLSLMGE